MQIKTIIKIIFTLLALSVFTVLIVNISFTAGRYSLANEIAVSFSIGFSEVDQVEGNTVCIQMLNKVFSKSSNLLEPNLLPEKVLNDLESRDKESVIKGEEEKGLGGIL